MKKLYIFLLLSISIITSCSEDVEFIQDPFVVAFKDTSGKLLEVIAQKNIELIYSETSSQNGEIKIQISTENVLYGRDFVTIPEAFNNQITVPIRTNEFENSFQIIELNDSFSDVMKITFSITDILMDNANIQGNVSYELSDNPYLGGSFSPTVGGPNQPNQVYVDLSSNKENFVRRDAWDLGFYGGDEFKVSINGSLYMATVALSTNDMNAVNEASVASLKPAVAVGTFNPLNENYIDAPDGDILKTAIAEVSDDDTKNMVYLVNLGAEVGTKQPNPGSSAVAGDPRGWKKIRILRENQGYKLQYADLNDTTYSEVLVSKDTDFNFRFFSFNSKSIVSLAPQKKQWDICFTVFTNVLPGAGSYGFSDFIVHNRKGGVTSYKLNNSSIDYTDFKLSDVDDSLLQEDQTVIGSSWRRVFNGGTVTRNIYYILKDSNNQYFKIRFLDLVNTNGERGYPRFEYALLQ